MNKFSLYLLWFTGSFFLNFLIIYFSKKIALRHSFLKNERGVVSVGGLGIVFSFLVLVNCFSFFNRLSLPFYFWWILFFSFLYFVVELFDDIYDFSLKQRVLTQLVLVAVFLFVSKGVQIYFLPVVVKVLVSFFWIAGVTNAFNLLDISDGLCSGVSLIISIFFLYIFGVTGNYFLFSVMVIFSGSLLAVYILNFPPAKVFLGNSGSHFIGFFFSAISLEGDYAGLDNVYAVMIPLFFLAVPIIDTVYLVLIRIVKGRSPLKPSDDHLFLRCLTRAGSRFKTLANFYLLTISFGLCGVFCLAKAKILFLVFLLLSLCLFMAILIQANCPGRQRLIKRGLSTK